LSKIENHKSHNLYYILDIPEEELSETIRSVSSQMGNKEMSGFTLFAREMRTKSILFTLAKMKYLNAKL